MKPAAFRNGSRSNLLVRDGGICGVVVHPCGGDFDKIEIKRVRDYCRRSVKLREVAYAARAANLADSNGWKESRA